MDNAFFQHHGRGTEMKLELTMDKGSPDGDKTAICLWKYHNKQWVFIKKVEKELGLE